MRLVDLMKTPIIVDPSCKPAPHLSAHEMCFDAQPNSHPISGDYAGMVTWSGIELGVTFLCACLPTIKVMLAVVKPRWFSDDTTKPSYLSPKKMESADSGESAQKGGGPAAQLPSLHLTNLHQWSATRTNWDWKREDIYDDAPQEAPAPRRDGRLDEVEEDDDEDLERFITSHYRGASLNMSPSRPAPSHYRGGSLNITPGRPAPARQR